MGDSIKPATLLVSLDDGARRYIAVRTDGGVIVHADTTMAQMVAVLTETARLLVEARKDRDEWQRLFKAWSIAKLTGDFKAEHQAFCDMTDHHGAIVDRLDEDEDDV